MAEIPASGTSRYFAYTFQIPARPTEKLWETQGVQLALGWMHAMPGSQPAAWDEHSQTQDCQCRRRSTGRACGDGDRQFWAGGSESPRDETPISRGRQRAQRGQCSPTSHRSCQELERREKQTHPALSPHPVPLRSAGVSPSTGPGEAAAHGPVAGGSSGAGAPPPPFRMLQPPTASP